ncbi:MAG: ATP-binding cassette domain-containing protein, partial [Casimicrobiaceae bacterium]
MSPPLLSVEALQKRYRRGRFSREVAFSLDAQFRVDDPAVIGVMGPNGSGKTTLFELITGSNSPSAGCVRIAGQDIHRVRYRERGRMAVHYHQTYQVRAIRRTLPSFLLAPADLERPLVHLFDEPQFNTQDGYIGFMLDFFRRLRAEGRVVFLCLHPTEPYHLEILREICERFIFVRAGALTFADDFASLAADSHVR